MKKLKKLTCALLALTTLAGSVGLVACGGGAKIVNDGKTVNIRMLKAGYGEDFIYELKSKFEAAYKDEGYKMNILEPSSDMRGDTALQEMARGNSATGIDLYIIGNVTVDQVGKDGEYGIVAEDIRELVHNQRAIGYDGKEEEKTVDEKLSADIDPFIEDSNGVLYGFNWSQSTAGLVVNTRKLAKYGITELPKTTNEMFETFETIYMGANGVANSEESTTFPVTYVSGTNGYTACAFWTWLAQYDYQGFKEFMSMKKDGVDMLEDGYEVFNTQGVQEMLTLAYRSMDQRIAAYGSTTQTLDQAQAKMMKDRNDAVFMFNGDWMLNEVKLNYRNYIGDIEFINTPLNSALGEKLFCKAPYNLNEARADELLSLIAGMVDERKSLDEIISAAQTEMNVTLSEEDAQEVATARGTIYTRGVEHIAYITKGSPNKELAALVLRMMASDDFAETFSQYANTATPYATIENLSNDNKFVQEAFAITTNPYVRSITNTLYGLRKQVLTAQLPGVNHIASTIYQQNVSMYDGKGGKIENVGVEVYENAAKTMKTTAYNTAKDSWETWLKNAGLK